MRVLIVDNSSVHLTKLQDLITEKLGPVEFVIYGPREMQDDHLPKVDLVIFSGGTGRSIEKNPQTFERMVDLAAKHKKPTVGICLGAEAIAVRFGSKLRELRVRRVGNVRINFTSAGHKDFSSVDSSVMAYEFHKWCIDGVKKPLKIVASSKDGVEIFKHADLPMWGIQFHPEVRRKNNEGHLVFEDILRDIGVLK